MSRKVSMLQTEFMQLEQQIESIRTLNFEKRALEYVTFLQRGSHSPFVQKLTKTLHEKGIVEADGVMLLCRLLTMASPKSLRPRESNRKPITMDALKLKHLSLKRTRNTEENTDQGSPPHPLLKTNEYIRSNYPKLFDPFDSDFPGEGRTQANAASHHYHDDSDDNVSCITEPSAFPLNLNEVMPCFISGDLKENTLPDSKDYLHEKGEENILASHVLEHFGLDGEAIPLYAQEGGDWSDPQQQSSSSEIVETEHCESPDALGSKSRYRASPSKQASTESKSQDSIPDITCCDMTSSQVSIVTSEENRPVQKMSAGTSSQLNLLNHGEHRLFERETLDSIRVCIQSIDAAAAGLQRGDLVEMDHQIRILKEKTTAMAYLLSHVLVAHEHETLDYRMEIESILDTKNIIYQEMKNLMILQNEEAERMQKKIQTMKTGANTKLTLRDVALIFLLPVAFGAAVTKS